MIQQLEKRLTSELFNEECSSMLDIVTTEAYFWKACCIDLIAKNQALEAECIGLRESNLLPCEVDDGK